MELKEILKTNDEFTNEDLEVISDCLLVLLTSITETVVELSVKSLKASCPDTYFSYEHELNFYKRRLSAVNKLHSKICEFIRNGGNN